MHRVSKDYIASALKAFILAARIQMMCRSGALKRIPFADGGDAVPPIVVLDGSCLRHSSLSLRTHAGGTECRRPLRRRA
jgi:hypothetical protein